MQTHEQETPTGKVLCVRGRESEVQQWVTDRIEEARQVTLLNDRTKRHKIDFVQGPAADDPKKHIAMATYHRLCATAARECANVVRPGTNYCSPECHVESEQRLTVERFVNIGATKI